MSMHFSVWQPCCFQENLNEQKWKCIYATFCWCIPSRWNCYSLFLLKGSWSCCSLYSLKSLSNWSSHSSSGWGPWSCRVCGNSPEWFLPACGGLTRMHWFGSAKALPGLHSLHGPPISTRWPLQCAPGIQELQECHPSVLRCQCTCSLRGLSLHTEDWYRSEQFQPGWVLHLRYPDVPHPSLLVCNGPPPPNHLQQLPEDSEKVWAALIHLIS